MWLFKWFRNSVPVSKRSEKMIMSGFAKLINDPITGKRQWATFNAEGGEHTNYPPMTPLVFPTEIKLPLGARIEIHVPIS